MVREHRPDLRVEHIGSTAVPGLPGKGIVDLTIATSPDDIPDVVTMLYGLGFAPQPGEDPFPPTRPMLVGSLDRDGDRLRIHVHVVPTRTELDRDLAFRDALRADPELTRTYAALKEEIVAGGRHQGLRYTFRKQAWITSVVEDLGYRREPIAPPATIGILGGGQLGRMLAMAARAMGYRIAILDPDPDCPAAALADRQVVAGYDDVGGALRLAALSSVVTYELEHVGIEVIDAIRLHRPVRPGRIALLATQDRIAERRFVEDSGVEVAPWREVHTTEDLRAAAADLGFPLRLKAAHGGYDGRGQIRLASDADIDGALALLGRPPGDAILAESEIDFAAELSIIVARGIDGAITTFPLARNVHDRGILVESVAPAPVAPEVAERAATLGTSLAVAMGLAGTLTAELFLMADGRLLVNELAPRVHNSGHWTIEAAATSQFEQHIRAICGLDLGATDAIAPAAMVNLLGSGDLRDARLEPAGMREAMIDPTVHLHLYDKRRVFERRKMGHVTAIDVAAAAAGETSTDAALERARAAVERLRWADEAAE